MPLVFFICEICGLTCCALIATMTYGPNRCRYSIEVMNALTISALM